MWDRLLVDCNIATTVHTLTLDGNITNMLVQNTVLRGIAMAYPSATLVNLVFDHVSFQDYNTGNTISPHSSISGAVFI